MTTIRHGALAQAIVRAQHLIDSRQRDQAAAVLREHLTVHQTQAPLDDPVLIHAATLYAMTEQGRPSVRLDWVRYAVAASNRLHGPTDPRTLTAVRAHALVLHELHRYDEAHRALAMLLTVCREFGLAAEALHPAIEMEEILHAQGRCGYAVRHAGQTWHSGAASSTRRMTGS